MNISKTLTYVILLIDTIYLFIFLNCHNLNLCIYKNNPV